MKLEQRKLADIRPYENNPRKNDDAVAAVMESIRQCGYVSPIVVDEDGVILAGHTRYKALRKLRRKAADVVIVPGLSDEQKRKFRILDNKTGELAQWDELLLRVELEGLDFGDFDFGLTVSDAETVTVSSYERRKSAGAEGVPNSDTDEDAEDIPEDEDSPEYQAFVEKFKPKKTTDDCYTPEIVYDAVADFVASTYRLERKRFVRPFFPGGDYQAFDYAPGAVVVDNPPFSILAEIVAWYTEKGIRYFLFAPTLTLFSSSSSCALPVGAAVIYENGASVNTSFLTNLENDVIRVRVRPELYRIVAEANARNLAQQRKSLPKYSYPDEILTAPMAAKWCRYGIPFVLPVTESARIGALDAQKNSGKTIFGSGYLMSGRMAKERAAAERAAAERAVAERAAAERWDLSDRERAMVRELDGEGSS